MTACRLAGPILLLLASVAAAQPAARPLFLEELTWTELRDTIQAGTTTILVPIGGTEQSGPYIALGKHNARAKALAAKIAAGLGDALVAPVVAYVPEGGIKPPTAHMRFPGTITVPDAAFEAVLDAAAESFRLAGFRDIIFLGDHGGYQKNERLVADRLNRRWAGTPVRAHAIEEYYRAAVRDYGEALRRHGLSDQEIGIHAGVADTSLTLVVDAGLVRLDALKSAAKPGPAEGVEGDPRQSSAELGQIGVDLIVEKTVAAVRQAVTRR